MKIGLIDADLMWRPRANGRRYGHNKADIFPNLALMKLSAYHKQKGNDVEWYNPFSGRYHAVFVSKVFSDTPESNEVINSIRVIRGGSGYCIHNECGKEQWIEPCFTGYMGALPTEVEHIYPDYSLYPMVKDTAFGFLTRGCPRGCGFCHVAAKEGRKSVKVADLEEWWHGQKRITLMDANILACPEWADLLRQLADSNAKVDINQGLDARLLTADKAEALARVKLSTIHFAWDDYKQKDAIVKGLETFAKHYPRKLEKGHQAQVFVLTNFDTTIQEDLERIYFLRDMNFEPYVMVYDKQKADPVYKSLQRWVNNRAIFHTVDTFEKYDKIKAKE
jgi:hypothetical protein